MAVEYYQVGGIIEFGEETAHPYISSTAGVTRLNPKPANLESEYRFSATFGGGVKVFPSEHIGFRLEGGILVPFYGSGFQSGCGLPEGCYCGREWLFDHAARQCERRGDLRVLVAGGVGIVIRFAERLRSTVIFVMVG